MAYVWIGYKFDGEFVGVFSTAEKAYSYLLDIISNVILDLNEGYASPIDGRSNHEMMELYEKRASELTKTFEELDPYEGDEFGCDVYWAARYEVD